MRTINLFFDFDFTSLSPDAQPISLGIVSEDLFCFKDNIHNVTKRGEVFCDDFENAKVIHPSPLTECYMRSFYAEFSDFDINRCDDWVKENVVGKLQFKGVGEKINGNDTLCGGITEAIKEYLKFWLSQFSDYNIQFVCDCGTFDWYWMLQMIGEWEGYPCEIEFESEDGSRFSAYSSVKKDIENHISNYKNLKQIVTKHMRLGLPILPSNVSPVPQDLNDLIALKKGISIREAFDLNREELAYGIVVKCMSDVDRTSYERGEIYYSDETPMKHTSIWDSKVIKAIYNKLK